MKKIRWKQSEGSLVVELDQPENNLCTYILKEKVISIPDKKDSDPLLFSCKDIFFAEKVLIMFLQARRKTLKSNYLYDKK